MSGEHQLALQLPLVMGPRHREVMQWRDSNPGALGKSALPLTEQGARGGLAGAVSSGSPERSGFPMAGFRRAPRPRAAPAHRRRAARVAASPPRSPPSRTRLADGRTPIASRGR